MSKLTKNILIAYIPSEKDLRIARQKHWYRIPVTTKNVPTIVKDNKVEMIAFYQPKAFKHDAHLIRYFGKVKSVTKVKRKILLKDEPLNEKYENLYYKIKIEKLLELPHQINSLRKRRILFITTTVDKLLTAFEINDLFIESPLEEKLWNELKRIGMSAERQFEETISKNNFFLDFALFCKNRKLAIECDGDTYHTGKNEVQKDKRRDNLLESRGWNVLRYTTDDIEHHFDDSINQVRETVNRFGGLEDIDDPSKSGFFPRDSKEPTLFDGID